MDSTLLTKYETLYIVKAIFASLCVGTLLMVIFVNILSKIAEKHKGTFK